MHKEKTIYFADIIDIFTEVACWQPAKNDYIYVADFCLKWASKVKFVPVSLTHLLSNFQPPKVSLNLVIICITVSLT